MLYTVLKGIPILLSLHWMQPASVQPSPGCSFCARAINCNAELNGSQDERSLRSFISDPSAVNHPSAMMLLFILKVHVHPISPALILCSLINTGDHGAWLHVTVCPFSALGVLDPSEHLGDLVFIHLYF